MKKYIPVMQSPPCAAANYMKKCTGRSRGPKGVCGKLEHGKRVDGSSVRACFTCGRPKGDTTAAPSRPSRRIGDGTYWAGTTVSEHCVQGRWAHRLSFNTGSSIK